MSLHRNDAPIALLSLVWSIAGLLGIFFAVLLSSFFLLKYFFPVSADPPTTGGSECTNVAIVNYPGKNAITDNYSGANYQHDAVEKAIGGTYRCSQICVPGVNASAPLSGDANKQVIGNYLKNATIGGSSAVVVNTGDEFVKSIKNDASITTDDTARLNRTVILSSLKSSCVGYNQPGGQGQSKDYDQIKVNNEAVEPVTPNTTANQPATQKNPLVNTGQADNPEPLAGPPLKDVPVPVGANGTGENTETIAQCRTKIYDFISKYQQQQNYKQISATETDPDYKRYTEVSAAYAALGKNDSDLARCHEIEKSVDLLTIKLWGTKTDLGKCKKAVNDFLNQYGNTKVYEPAFTDYKNVQTDYRNIKFNPLYWVSSARQLKLCKEALGWMDEYKVAAGITLGPQLATATQKQQATQQDQQATISQVQYLNGIPQPQIDHIYDISGAIKASTKNPDGKASLIIDRSGNVYWSMHIKHKYGNQVPRTITIIAPVSVYPDRTYSKAKPWDASPGLGNIDSVYGGESKFRGVTDPNIVSEGIYQRIYQGIL